MKNENSEDCKNKTNPTILPLAQILRIPLSELNSFPRSEFIFKSVISDEERICQGGPDDTTVLSSLEWLTRKIKHLAKSVDSLDKKLLPVRKITDDYCPETCPESWVSNQKKSQSAVEFCLRGLIDDIDTVIARLDNIEKEVDLNF